MFRKTNKNEPQAHDKLICWRRQPRVNSENPDSRTDCSQACLSITLSSLCNFLCVVVVSLCQFDSPVLLWPGYDNGALLAICNPPFDCLHQILHCNHNLTNLLGASIDKTQRMKFALLTAQLLSSPKDSPFPIVSLGNTPTITDGAHKADTVNK